MVYIGHMERSRTATILRHSAAATLAAVVGFSAMAATAWLMGDAVARGTAEAGTLIQRATSTIGGALTDLAHVIAGEPTLANGQIVAAYKLPDEGKAIVANLAEMKLHLFEDGERVESYDIKSRGRPGTAWETPPGSYAVKAMEREHFSSIGGVWMPYSMQFQGNFFIHGWPYYANGAPVAEGYSGGCIRMSTEEMAEIYEFAERGTPVIVLGDASDGAATSTPATTAGGYALLPKAPSFPSLGAAAFVVGDLDTGEVLAKREETTPRPIASVTKLVTAITSLEILNQYREVEVSEDAVATNASFGNLRVGETLTTGDLIYPLLLESSNDAAEVLAEEAGRNYFIDSMNAKAEALGLADTSFDDPSGLSPNNVSTPADLFKLAQYLHNYKQFALKTSVVKEYAVGDHKWRNSSKLLGDERYRGGKHGYTDEAGKTLVATFAVPLSEFDDRNIAVVILKSPDPAADARKAVDYLERWAYWTPVGGETEVAAAE
jgi:D-alanyl-D-alanine endopeptidase (penicillin-binding protein 7)